MDFYTVLDEAIHLLRSRGRVAYRALKRQFDLDDDYLEDLKDALLYAHPVVDDGRGLLWTGDPAASEPDAQRGADAESRFHELILTVIGLLQRERRITYRRLKHVFRLDNVLLEDVRKELLFTQVARDEQGEGLVWTGDTHPVIPLEVDVSSQSDTASTTAVSSPTPSTLPLHTPETSAPSHEPTSAPESLPTDAPEPVRRTPEAERRQLTVMFCDLADSTKLSQQLDPEDLREVIRAYQQTAAEVIQRFDGTIAQHLGDGLLVYFGWPVAHEDDAQRSLYAGLGIVEAITTTLNPRLEREKSIQLAVRIGIHTGSVVVGEMGGGGRYENLATGGTVNIAARLEGLAQPNTVVIASVTERLVQGAFALENLGPQKLKGVTEPIPVFRVLGATEDHKDETGAVSVPFLVGRDEEIGLLRRRWEQSKEGLGQVVLICGEAGIGKSSLVATVRYQVVEAGYTRLTFRCSPYHTNSALYPVIAHMQRVLQWQPGETPETTLDKFERVLKCYSRPLDEVVPLYAALLSVPVPEGRYAALNLSPQQQRHQTQDALVGWLLEEAERHPTLAVWEDLHWADASTLELLGLILEQTPTVSMLNVLTYRPEFIPPWPTRSYMTPLSLNRLERPQVEALITHLAGGKSLPAEVVQHVLAKTDGVPLYVEELIKMLLGSDLLREEADQFALTGPLVTVAIPDTLRDSLMARLDQLNMAKEVAQLGAVLGREFAYVMLQAVAGMEEDALQEGLTRLVDAELLYQRGRPPRARYIFKHALIQDAAYASLLKRTRQQVHQRIAHVLEAWFPETVETEPELLAHHYTAAGRLEEAIAYWQRAGERATDHAANTEALGHLAQGLKLLGTLPESPARLQSELRLQTIRGRVLTALKGYGDAEVAQVYTRARQLCQQLGDTPQLFPVLLGLSIYFVVRAELHTAQDLGEQLLRLAQQGQDPVRLVEAHYALGVTYFWCGEFTQAREHLEQGVAHYNPQQHPAHLALYGQDGGAVCLCRLAMVLWYVGYPDQALARGHEALAIAEELAHPFSRAYVLTWLAYLYVHRGAVPDTQEWIDAATRFAIEQAFPYWSTQGTVLQGWLLSQQGHLQEGIELMRQGVTNLQAVGTEIVQAYALGLLAEAYDRGGQPMKGLSCLDKALAKVYTNGEHWPEAELHRLRGELLQNTACGVRHAEYTPEACFRQAIDIARRQAARALELRAATSLARLWQQQGKLQEAYDLLAPVYEWFTEGFDTADLKEAKALLDELRR